MSDNNDEPLLDPMVMLRDLTVKVGEMTRVSFESQVNKNAGGLADAVTKHADKISELPLAGREIYLECYDKEDKEELQGKANPFGVSVMDALKMQPAFPEIRAAASCAPVVASKAAADLLGMVCDTMDLDKMQAGDDEGRTPEQIRQDMEQVKELMKGQDPQAIRDALDALAVQAKRAEGRRNLAEANLTHALQSAEFGEKMEQALDNAKKGKRSVQSLASFGVGGEQNLQGNEAIPDELVEMVAGDDTILEILEQCGRLETIARAAGLEDIADGKINIVGVQPGDDVTMLIPEELSMFSDDDTEFDFYNRLMNKETLTWETHDEEPKGKGPLSLILDKSSSMRNHMIYLRSIGAFFVMRAIKEGREVTFTMFDSGATTVHVRGPEDLDKVVRLLGASASGGTDVPPAFHQNLDSCPNLADADIVLITDGVFTPLDKWDPTVLDRIREMSGGNARLFGVLLNHESWGEGHDYFDKTWAFNADDEGAAASMLKELGK